MPENIQSKINKIQTQTGIEVVSYKIINSGADSLIIDINDQWIFRFPRKTESINKMNNRLDFLKSFLKSSNLKVPNPKYTGDDYIGYKKIQGTPMYQEEIENLKKTDRLKIA